MSAVPAQDVKSARFVGLDEVADLSVMLVNYNTAHLLERCLANLRATSGGLAVRVVIVDNASRDGSAAFIRERLPDCVLVANETNVGFGRANNQALALCPGPSELQIESELLCLRKHNGLVGLLLTVMLNLMVNAVDALKWVWKGRPPAGLTVVWRNAVTVCRLALQTRLGVRATR